MSVSEKNIIDGLAADGETLVMLLADSLTWDGHEAEHLKLMQEKFNEYLRYIRSKGYRNKFGDREFCRFRIEVGCLYRHSPGLDRMIEAVQDKLDEMNTTIVISDAVEASI